MQHTVELFGNLGQRIGQGCVGLVDESTRGHSHGSQATGCQLHSEPRCHDVLDGVHLVEDEYVMVR